jgi:DNA topoisomerase-1
MENDLDAISNGKESKLKVLEEFWKRVKKDLETAKVKRVEFNTTKHDCPKCKKAKLIKKFSSFGPFYGCANYNAKEDKCAYTAQIGEDGSPVEKVKKKVEYSDEHVCPKCKGKMAIRKGKYGDFLGCSKFPKCKSMMTMEGEVIVSKKSKWKKGKK